MGQHLRSKSWQGIELFKSGRCFFLSSCLVFSGTPPHSSLEDRLKRISHLLLILLCNLQWALQICSPSYHRVCKKHKVGSGSDGTLARKVAISLMDREVAEVRLKIWQQPKETEYIARGNMVEVAWSDCVRS